MKLADSKLMKLMVDDPSDARPSLDVSWWHKKLPRSTVRVTVFEPYRTGIADGR